MYSYILDEQTNPSTNDIAFYVTFSFSYTCSFIFFGISHAKSNKQTIYCANLISNTATDRYSLHPYFPANGYTYFATNPMSFSWSYLHCGKSDSNANRLSFFYANFIPNVQSLLYSRFPNG